MNINSTSSYSYGSSASKGISGLASGLDTESQVKEMLSGTQSKIDKQEGLKQQVEWKQEIYRDLISQINTFQTSYFSSTSATSLTSTQLYNTMSATSESKNFKVTASTSAPVGNTTLEVHQLATNYSLSSGSAVSGKLGGTMSADALQKLVNDQLNGNKQIIFKVGDETKVTVDLKEFFVKDGKFVKNIDADGIANKIQSALKSQAGLTTKVTMAGGQLSIVSEDGERTLRVSSESSQQAMDALGLTASSEAKADRNKTKRTLTSKLNLTPSLSFKATLDDGLQKEISLDVRNLVGDDGKVNFAKVQEELQTTFDEEFGKGVAKITVGNDGALDIATTIAGRKITINRNGSSDVLKALGLKDGQSNRIAAYNTLKELQISTPLQGNRFSFEINGAQFSFSEDDDIDYVLSTINASTAGVTIAYKPLEDAFVMTANDAGAGREIRMKQTEGNLLNVMFGKNGGNTGSTVTSAAYTASGGVLKGGTLTEADVEALDIQKGTFSLTVNGKDYTIEIPAKATADKKYTLDELVQKINAELKTKLGTTGETDADGEDIPNVELVVEDGKISLVPHNGASISLKGAADKGADDAVKTRDLVVALGLAEKDQKVDNLTNSNTKLSDIPELGNLVTLLGKLNVANPGDVTLAGLKDATKDAAVTIAFEDGRFTITKNDASFNDADIKLGDDALMEKLFGTKDLVLGAETGSAAYVTEGRNAIVRIDGTLTERNSNVFTYNGLTVELTGVSKVVKDEDGNTATMKGEVVDANGKKGLPSALTQPQYGEGRWIDSNGYLRKGTAVKDAQGKITSYVYSNSDKYVTMNTGALTDAPIDDPEKGTTRRYEGLSILNADGERMSGVGIAYDGTIISGSGAPLQARETSTISVTRDTDKIVDGIKGFIEEYNKLVSTIATYLNEDAEYRDYAPLTEEQRAEMTDKQIELWEEKAKTGLLRRDSILDGFLQSMRQIWYETNSSGYAIYQFGIETADWSTRGQLTLSADGEATLRSMLAKDPTGVMNFFTNTVDGAAVRVNDVIKEVANTSSGSPGTLVQLAGIKGKASEKNNTLYDQIKSIDEKIERLKDQYESEKDRYWNQFNTMEQLIANMNQQSSWLASQFSY